QETATVTNLASQLQYVIKNTTGGGAGLWQSNQALLSNLGGIIAEQQGISYSIAGVGQQFQQFYPGYTTGTSVTPQASTNTALNTLSGVLQSLQMQSQNFAAEQSALSALEVKNGVAIGALQAIQTSGEIALQETQQAQELRQVMMSATNAQTVALAQQINAQTVSQQTATAIMGAPSTIITLAPPGPSLPLIGGNIP